eukprot:NODE_1043_length_1038_cov_113.058178_g998_i0.p1 GENE.NODE_1043_length_1038_cov_113.058178_g998_i0~~NODE_1043_length_1038_cov_113.058178_g998_i0.p1  ORF type:complete len:206 (-),score=17.02 NODE_1043_length_1038_cov_113.058178_g998_i0:366-983(-)
MDLVLFCSRFLAWFWHCLYRIGLHTPSFRVLVTGIDNAGKTVFTYTLLYSDKSMRSYHPTSMPTVEQVNVDGIGLRLFDLPGYHHARRIWSDYLCADAIIFIVDGSDPDRFPEVRDALCKLVAHVDARDKPLLILLNKMDLPTFVGLEAATTALQLNRLRGLMRLHVQECSFVHKFGYGVGTRWLAKTLYTMHAAPPLWHGYKLP